MLDLAGMVLIFFAISTNQEYYTFPASLALMMLLAEELRAREREDCAGAGVRTGSAMSAGVLAVIGLVARCDAAGGAMAIAESAV